MHRKLTRREKLIIICIFLFMLGVAFAAREFRHYQEPNQFYYDTRGGELNR
jgi:hypothetical protein